MESLLFLVSQINVSFLKTLFPDFVHFYERRKITCHDIFCYIYIYVFSTKTSNNYSYQKYIQETKKRLLVHLDTFIYFCLLFFVVVVFVCLFVFYFLFFFFFFVFFFGMRLTLFIPPLFV